MYPAITSDAQRHDYKREFDADLREYKRLCAEMDDINDQLNKLSRQLDALDDTSAKYQVGEDKSREVAVIENDWKHGLIFTVQRWTC